MALAMSYWPRRCSKARVERERMPPGAKKSWRFGRFSGGAGVIEMGAEVDKVGIDLSHDSRGEHSSRNLVR